jgi:hypothetical protein
LLFLLVAASLPPLVPSVASTLELEDAMKRLIGMVCALVLGVGSMIVRGT